MTYMRADLPCASNRGAVRPVFRRSPSSGGDAGMVASSSASRASFWLVRLCVEGFAERVFYLGRRRRVVGARKRRVVTNLVGAPVQPSADGSTRPAGLLKTSAGLLKTSAKLLKTSAEVLKTSADVYNLPHLGRTAPSRPVSLP